MNWSYVSMAVRVVEIIGCSEVTATSYLKRMEAKQKTICGGRPSKKGVL